MIGLLANVQDTGITIDLFYVFLRIVEIVLELALLLVAWRYLPPIFTVCDAIMRSFISEGPREIADRIAERLAKTKVVVTASDGGLDTETAESIGGSPAKIVVEPMHPLEKKE